MKRNLPFLFLIFLGLSISVLISCSKEEARPTFPLTAEIFHSVSGSQVAFTGLTHSATSWSWDFGDGNTSTEKDPVHIYEEGGYYVATLKANDASGNELTRKVTVAVALTPYALLTGDFTAAGYQGKKWKLSSAHNSSGDYLANSDADLSVVAGTPKPLPDGVFKSEFGMEDIYKDEFTFSYDGSYVHDVKEDGGSFGGLVYEYATNGGEGIINANGAPFGLAIVEYTPATDATFTFNGNEDLTLSSKFGGSVVYNDVMTLDFSHDEFIGFRDFQRKVILRSISDNKMQLVMFMATGQTPATIGVNTNALVLSFDAVN